MHVLGRAERHRLYTSRAPAFVLASLCAFVLALHAIVLGRSVHVGSSSARAQEDGS